MGVFYVFFNVIFVFLEFKTNFNGYLLDYLIFYGDFFLYKGF